MILWKVSRISSGHGHPRKSDVLLLLDQVEVDRFVLNATSHSDELLKVAHGLFSALARLLTR